MEDGDDNDSLVLALISAAVDAGRSWEAVRLKPLYARALAVEARRHSARVGTLAGVIVRRGAPRTIAGAPLPSPGARRPRA
jgi:hypothetical protein